MEDITKTGIQGLKGLSHRGQSNLSMDELIELDRANRQQGTSPEQVASRFNVQGVQDIGNQLILVGYGDSSYDEGITMSLLDDLLDIRAERQPWYSQIANGLAKGALLAGTTFLDGTLGLLFGSVAAMNEGRWSALWDNDFSRAMLSINEKSEELLPNYYSEAELNEPWYENIFTANFLGDKFIKNLGFTVGAFYSGGLLAGAVKGLGKLAMRGAKSLGATTKAIKNISKTTNHVASALGAVTSAVNEGRIEALNNSKEWYEATLAPIQDDYQLRRAAFEEIGDYDSILELDAHYEETLAKLNEDRMKMGNADLLMNLPILTASNLIQFGKMYANGFRTGRRANNIVGNITEGYTAGTTRKAGIKKAILDPLSEGAEEISQGAASRISGDYYQTDINNFYKAKTDPDAQEETLSWWKSFAQGINETVNDGSAWEEFFIGTLTGAMGMPRFRGVRNEQGKFQSPVTLEGGILGELRENREQMAREQQIVDYMNNRLQSPEFRNYYQGLSRHNYYQAAMDLAIQDNDEFAFKNAEQAQFISDVSMFDAAGKIEDLTTLINSAYDTSDENLESIKENTTSIVTAEQLALLINDVISALDLLALDALETGDSEALNYANTLILALENQLSNLRDIHIGPFVDQDGNPLYATEQGKEEMIDKLTKTKDEMLGLIDDYVKAKIDLQGRLPQNISNDLLEELIFLLTQVNNWDKRGEEMTPIIKSILADASTSLRTLASALELAGNTLDSEAYNSNALFIEQLVLDNTPKQLMLILSHPGNSKLVSLISNTIGAYGNDVINNLDKLNVLQMLDDIVKIGKSKDLYQKRLEEYIANPTALTQAHEQAREQQETTRRVSEDISRIDRINNSSVSDIVQDIENAELDLNSFDDFFGEEEATEARDKVELARDIIETDKRTRADLGQLASTEEISEQALEDALALLDSSKAVANSSEELLDLDTEAFNDPHALDDADARETVAQIAEKEGWTLDQIQLEYNNIMNQRLDDAKNALSIVRNIGLERDAELSDIPSGTTQLQPVTETVLTGHDSVDSNEPVNAPVVQQDNATNANRELTDKTLSKYGHSRELSPELAKAFDNIFSYVDRGIAKGLSDKDILDAISKTLTYLKLELSQWPVGPLIKRVIDTKRLGTSEATQLTKPVSTPIDLTPDTQSSYETEIDGENRRDVSNLITEAEFDTAQREGTSIDAGKIGGNYNYWRPSTTELPIHRERGNDTPYWLTVNSPAKGRYQAVYEYLKDNGAFSRVNNNQVKKGDEVHFGISKELSEKVGKPIILLLNSDNEVIGDLPMPEDANFNNYVGLPLLYEGASNWYKENHESLHTEGNDIAVIPGYKSNVARNMVGKPQYTSQDERHTLNQINTVTTSDGSQKQVPFRLGIAIANADSDRIRIMSDAGRSKSQGASPLERTIIAPLKAVKGLPFLLMPTSSSTRAFMPVPIMMPRFDMSNPSIANSSLGQEVSKKVQELATIPNNTDLIMKWIDSMRELLSIPEIHVNFSNQEFSTEGRLPQLLIVTIKRPGETKLTTIFKGPQEQAVDAVLNGLNGSMFQVSRKYINDSYNGKSYNEMIGELAETNLPIGATHTINDWFTIDPIVDRKQQKAHSPKSTRVNPTLTQGTVVRFQDTSGNSYYMTNSNRLYKENPEGGDIELTGSKYNSLKAHAYGARINETFTRPYDTPWGYYNPLTHEFEVKPTEKPTDTVSSSPNTLTAQQPKPQETSLKPSRKEVSLRDLKVGDVYELSYVEYPNVKPEAYTVEEVKPDGKLVVHKNSDFSKRIVTPKNINDYGTPKIIRIEQKSSTSTEKPATTNKGTEPQVTREDAMSSLKLMGLLNKKERNAALDKLSDDRLAKVAGMPKLKARLTLERFDTKIKANMDSDAINDAFDSVAGSKPLNREVTKLMEIQKNWNRDSEITRVKKILPQLSEEGRIKLVDALIKITNSPKPAYAYGQFQDGIITLSKFGRGTAYHESFHFVTQALLSQKELNDLYNSAEKQYGKLERLELEENLAEDFRRFMLSYEDDGFFKNIFKTLKHIIKSLVGKETITNKLFHDIRRGTLASRSVNTNRSRLNRQETYTKEQQSILDGASRDNQGRLLAPNGKPSNLNERQYVQVRTKAFKSWFGDWENKSSESSKVVDENGEPLVVYHGTAKEFDTFNAEIGKGSYFTSDIDYAKAITEIQNYNRVIPVFLNIKNLKETDTPLVKDIEDDLYWTDVFEGKQAPDGIKGHDLITDELNIKSKGDEYIVFNPNQIKSATSNTGEFSTTNDSIYYRRTPVELTLELNNLRQLWKVSHSKKFQDEVKEFNDKVNRNWDAAYNIINKYGLRDVAYVFEGQYGAAKIGVQSLKKFTELADRLKAQIQDAYEAELSDDERLSNLALEELETYYREIEQYHREKLDYGRLNQEQRDYITERGLSIEEYNSMTPQEKEVLFRCMY